MIYPGPHWKNYSHMEYAEYLPKKTKNMTCGIYLIKDQISEKFYVGSSKEIEIRFRTHVIELNKGIHCNPKLQNLWNRRDPELDWEFEIIEKCSEEIRISREQYYLDTLKPVLNINKVAGLPPSHKGIKHSEERRKATGERIRKLWQDPAYRERMAENCRNQRKDPEFMEKLLNSVRKNKTPEHCSAISRTKKLQHSKKKNEN